MRSAWIAFGVLAIAASLAPRTMGEETRSIVYMASVRSGEPKGSPEITISGTQVIVTTELLVPQGDLGSLWQLEPNQLLEFSFSIPDAASNIRLAVTGAGLGSGDVNLGLKINDDVGFARVSIASVLKEGKLRVISLDPARLRGGMNRLRIGSSEQRIGIQSVKVAFDVPVPSVSYGPKNAQGTFTLVEPRALRSVVQPGCKVRIRWQTTNPPRSSYVNLAYRRSDKRVLPIAVALPINFPSLSGEEGEFEWIVPDKLTGDVEIVTEPFAVAVATENGILYKRSNASDATNRQTFPRPDYRVSKDFRTLLYNESTRPELAELNFRVVDIPTGNSRSFNVTWKRSSEIRDLDIVGWTLSPDGRYVLVVESYIPQFWQISPDRTLNQYVRVRVVSIDDGKVVSIWDLPVNSWIEKKDDRDGKLGTKVISNEVELLNGGRDALIGGSSQNGYNGTNRFVYLSLESMQHSVIDEGWYQFYEISPDSTKFARRNFMNGARTTSVVALPSGREMWRRDYDGFTVPSVVCFTPAGQKLVVVEEVTDQKLREVALAHGGSSWQWWSSIRGFHIVNSESGQKESFVQFRSSDGTPQRIAGVNPLRGFQFLPDGTRILTSEAEVDEDLPYMIVANSSGRVNEREFTRIRDASSGRVLFEWPSDRLDMAFSHYVSPDSRFLLFATDGAFHIRRLPQTALPSAPLR